MTSLPHLSASQTWDAITSRIQIPSANWGVQPGWSHVIRTSTPEFWIWRQNLCVAAARLSPATTQGCQPTLMCKMCIPVLTFKKTFGPINFEQMIGLQPNCNDGLPPGTACLLQNNDSQIPILSAQRPRMCAWVRLSFPYYRVRMTSIIPVLTNNTYSFLLYNRRTSPAWKGPGVGCNYNCIFLHFFHFSSRNQAKHPANL